MTGRKPRSALVPWLASTAACLVGLAATIVLVHMADVEFREASDQPKAVEDIANIGTMARITRGGVTIEKRLPRMDFDWRPGESIDPKLPDAGPIEAEFTVTFVTGPVRQAMLGVELQGGSVIITRRGKVLLSTFAGDTSVTKMAIEPEMFGLHQQQVILNFQSDGTRPVHLRALWQPMDNDEPSPLPSEPAVIWPQ